MEIAEAEKKVLAHVNKICPLQDDELIIVEHQVLDNNLGWIFFYNSRKFVETNSVDYAIAGNSPVIVKKNGEMIRLSTLNWENELSLYEKKI